MWKGGINSYKWPGFGFTTMGMGKMGRLEEGQGVAIRLRLLTC